jgi:IS30 family transposase
MASHLTLQEREILYRMKGAGKPFREIAEALGRDRSTLYREVNRNSGGRGYRPKQADRMAKERRVACRQPRKLNNPEIRKYVTARLDKKWSPEQIAGRIREDLPRKKRCHVSYQTIYNWLAIDARQLREHRRRGTRRTKPETRGQLKDSVSIAGRPKVVDSKRRYGDWEGDTVVSPGRRSGLTTMVERKSQYLRVRKTKSLKSIDTLQAINGSLQDLPPELLRTITLDNGKEFAEHRRLTDKLGAQVYFARPYASWQRGLNENTNGLLRQFFPKGTDFARISRRQVARAEILLNERPRKSLGYRTPSEIFHKKRAAIKV